MHLEVILEFEEGYRRVPYLCSEGYVTAGLGTKLHNKKGMNPKDFPIRVSREVATLWLQQDVAKMELALNKTDKGGTFKGLDEDRRAIIISMAYQMGVHGVLGFPSMWRALARQDWEEAGAQALDSLWARQTPERAGRHARVLAGETLEEVYK